MSKRIVSVLFVCCFLIAATLAEGPAAPLAATATPDSVSPGTTGHTSDSPLPVDANTAAAAAPNEQLTKPPALPPDIPPFLIKMGMVGAKYDGMGPWDWDANHYPSIGDSIMGEAGGVRSDLAKKGLYYSLWLTDTFNYNLKNAPMYGMPADPDGVKRQAYVGQKPTFYMMPNFYVTYTPPRLEEHSI